MPEFQTSNGYTVLVDDIDLPMATAHRWFGNLQKSKGKVYVQRNTKVEGKSATIYLHREIVGTFKGEEADHRNGDSLDNRRENLRVCTRQQNQANRRIHRNNKSGFKGVRCLRGLFQAQVADDVIGMFSTAQDAARAYDAVAVRRYGEFASINFPDLIGNPLPTKARIVRGKSGFRGVYAVDRGFQARLCNRHVGFSKDPVEAAKMYDRAAIALKGPLARLNFPAELQVA